MSNAPRTSRTQLIALRLPVAMHAALAARGPVSPQIVEAVGRYLAAAEPPLDAAAARDAARKALAQEQADG